MNLLRNNNTPPKPPPVAWQQQPVRPGAARNEIADRLGALRDRVQRRLLSELSPTVRTDNVDEVRRALERIYAETLVEEDVPLSRGERAELFERSSRHPGLRPDRAAAAGTTASPKS